MLQRLFRMTMVVAVVGITTLVAQKPAGAAQQDPIGLLKALPGLQSAHGRKYISVDRLGLGGVATPAPVHPGLVVTATVLEFKTPADLAIADRLFLNASTVKQVLGEPTGTVVRTVITDLGVKAQLYLVRTDIGDGQAHAMLVAVRDNLGFLIRADGPEPSLKPVLLAFGQFMAHARVDSNDVVLRPPAASSGGTWDLLPSAQDAALLQDLIPKYDYDLLGPTGESPIGPTATPAG